MLRRKVESESVDRHIHLRRHANPSDGNRSRRRGRFEDAWSRTYPRLQIITLAELFQGKKPEMPFVDPASFKRAKREETGKQGSLI